MEDASAVDLDWFWRGWFYSTDNVDVKLSGAHQIEIDQTDRDSLLDGKYAYQVDLENLGGLPTPVYLTFNYIDGTSEDRTIPAEIWRRSDEVSKLFFVDKMVSSIVFDKENVLADVDTTNNTWTNE